MIFMHAKRLSLTAIIAVLILYMPAVIAQPAAVPEHNVHNQPPEQEDSTLTWEDLTDLEVEVETPAPLQSIFHIKFPEKLTSKNGKQVQIKGFMYPLKAGETHDYFLLSALPPSCPFCLPGGQTTLIEVKCEEPVEYTLEPVLLSGTFNLLKDDPSGLYYHLTDARAVSD